MNHFAPIHMVDYASQPDIRFRCDKTWDTPSWDQLGKESGEVFQAKGGRFYTFTESKITCEKCRKDPEPPMAA